MFGFRDCNFSEKKPSSRKFPGPSLVLQSLLHHLLGKLYPRPYYLSRTHSILSNENHEIEKQIFNLHARLEHPGVSRTYYTLKHLIDTPNLKEKVRKVVESCLECLLNKIQTKDTEKHSESTGKTAPFEKTSSDTFDPLTQYLLMDRDTDTLSPLWIRFHDTVNSTLLRQLPPNV